MEEWKEYRLGEIGEIITGKTPSTKVLSYYDGSIHFVGPADLNNCNRNILSTSKTISELGLNSIRGSILPKGAICVSCIGNLGYVGITTMQCASNQQINSIIVDESKFDRDYIYYTIRLLWRFFKSQENQSTTISILNKTTFSNIKFFAPSLEKQKLISEVLSNFDDKIEVNRRINEQLEELAQALFKSWFVDFEPFKDSEFMESELGMIPKGWKVGKLGDYCKVKSGYAFKSSWWQDKGLKVIKIKNITSNGELDMNECSYVAPENTLKAKDFKTEVGDLLIAMTGATIGKFCMVCSNETMYVNQRVGKFFLGSNPIIRLPFIYCTLKTDRVYSEIVNKGQGSAQPNISGSDIENIRIPLPDNIDILSMFNEKMKDIFDKVIRNQQEITHLTTLRDTLLPKLMSGEIDVNEVEI